MVVNKFKAKKKYIWTIFVVILCITIICTLNTINKNKIINSSFQVTREEISFSNLPSSFDGYKILQITDLHSMEFGKNNADLISAINKLSPDVIFVTGDMFSSSEFKNSDDFSM